MHVLLFPINNAMTYLIILSHDIILLVGNKKTVLCPLQLSFSLKNGKSGFFSNRKKGNMNPNRLQGYTHPFMSYSK